MCSGHSGVCIVFQVTDLWRETYPGAAVGVLALGDVTNPPHHPAGDFALDGGRVGVAGASRYTFGGIGVYRAELFEGCAPGRFPLAPLLRAAMARGQVGGELYEGRWVDVGTPERLAEVDRLAGVGGEAAWAGR